MQTVTAPTFRAHIVDAVLDRLAGRAVARFAKRVSSEHLRAAMVDLRGTSVITSEGWAALVSAVTHLFDEGREVSLLGSQRLQGLFELSTLTRKARLVMFGQGLLRSE